MLKGVGRPRFKGCRQRERTRAWTPPRRAVGVLKWIGTMVCALILVAWGVSERWRVCYVGAHWNSAIIDGALETEYLHHSIAPSARGWHVYWGYGRFKRVWPGVLHFSWGTQAILPLWLPLVAVAVSTAFLWRRALQRPPLGHCQKCGYNLTGNVSGRCPECGAPVPARSVPRKPNA